jgi:hypothetical protein
MDERRRDCELHACKRSVGAAVGTFRLRPAYGDPR